MVLRKHVIIRSDVVVALIVNLALQLIRLVLDLVTGSAIRGELELC